MPKMIQIGQRFTELFLKK